MTTTTHLTTTTMTNTKVKVTAVRDDDLDNNNKLERKITIATDGLQPQFIRKLKHRDTTKNTETICDYIIAMNVLFQVQDGFDILLKKNSNPI
jgi:hypothetical protein